MLAKASMLFSIKNVALGWYPNFSSGGSSWVNSWNDTADPAILRLDAALDSATLKTRVWLQASASTTSSAKTSWVLSAVSHVGPSSIFAASFGMTQASAGA